MSILDNILSIDNFITEQKLYANRNRDYPNLVLIKYIRGRSKLSDPIAKKLRGYIFDLTLRKALCYPVHMREEYSYFKKNNKFGDITITPYIEGTMINLYYFDDKWHLSTKSRLDASKSKWKNKKNFSQLMLEASDIYYEKLNNNYCYSFVLQHMENKIVSEVKSNRVFLAMVRDLKTDRIITDDVSVTRLGSNISNIPKITKFRNYDDLEKSLKSLTVSDCGYMLKQKDGEDRSRLLAPKYEKVLNYNGNCYHITRNLMKIEKDGNINGYLVYYPHHKEIYDNYTTTRNKLLRKIYKLYIMSRVNYIFIPKYLRGIIHEIHQIFLKNKQDGVKDPKINLAIIKDYFKNKSLGFQYYILKNYNQALK